MAVKPTPRKRGRAGQRDRARRLALYPLCAHCEAKDKATATQEIDHIIPLHLGVDMGGVDTDENCQGLCFKCHEIKTRQELGYNERITYGLDGYPIEGEGG